MGGVVPRGPEQQGKEKAPLDELEIEKIRQSWQQQIHKRPSYPKRRPMPEQNARSRLKNWKEAPLGYSPNEAIAEAKRCIFCSEAPCIRSCPVGVNIIEFIRALGAHRVRDAARIIRRTNNLPAITSRVCPQENQCEGSCRPAEGTLPVAILNLERYVADWELKHAPEDKYQVKRLPTTGKRVAVVGSGPAGLTAAADLARMGHAVTIFEGLHKPGGVLTFGIPEYRLPKNIVELEIDYVKWLGVAIECNTVVGCTLMLDDLLGKERFQAVFLGTGAGLPILQGIPGENLPGVYAANEYLTRINLMKAYQFPKYDTPINVGRKVAVVGGANTAMDAARTALRLGAQEVSVLYRRSEGEMTARVDEVKRARDEGVIFRMLTLPKRYRGNGNGWVGAVECIKMELGALDDEGRPTPVEIAGSEFIIEVDTVIVAIGVSPNQLLMNRSEGLSTTVEGTVVADPVSGQTTRPSVWAGGDMVTGAATVISAMGAGKRAAQSIDAYLKERDR